MLVANDKRAIPLSWPRLAPERQSTRRQHPHSKADREGKEHPGEQIQWAGPTPGDYSDEDVDARPADRRYDPEHEQAEYASSVGGEHIVLCRPEGGQRHRSVRSIGMAKVGVLVAGATAFGEKCAGQGQGAGDAKPDARMQAAL
jgi:hypothetical protein